MSARGRRGISAYCIFFIAFFAILLAAHALVLDLPYFWDELGQFIPAALDIFYKGAWVPETTLPNVHPPGVMAYLAGVWTVFGYSVPVTRVAMLAIAAFGLVCVFALAIELCGPLSGAPAFYAVALLLASPLFWAQSMMAQLDMPAMSFTALGLVLFLKGRYVPCAIACTFLVLAKETGIVVPFVFGVLLLLERRIRNALWFLLPALALAVWLVVLHRATGHIFGNREFTHYNIAFQFHPVRMPVTILRRIFYLFIDNFHWVGTIALISAWCRTEMFRNRAWAVVTGVAFLQTVVVSVLGGAALERYLIPVLPLFYIAVAASWTAMAPVWHKVSATAMIAGFIAGIFINSPFAYPFENNSAFVSFVELQKRAAEYLEAEYPHSTAVSAWPFPDALRRPEFGFVRHPVPTLGIDNFNPETVLAAKDRIGVLVIYSRTWESKWGVLRMRWVKDFLAEYYFYKPQITREQIESSLDLRLVARWEQAGQWIEIYAKEVRTY